MITLRKVRTYMHALGFDDAVLLANTGLYASDFVDPYRVLDEEQARRFYLNVVEVAGQSGVGLEIGWKTSIYQKGPVGLLQISSRTVREALEEGYSTRLTYDVLVEWEYEIREDVIVHRLYTEEENQPLRIFLLERALGMLQAHTEELAGPGARPLKALLDYPAPRNFERYSRIFRCPVFFDQPRLEVIYPRHYLEVEVGGYDPQAHDALERLQSSLLKKLSNEEDIVDEVKMVLRKSPGEFRRLEQVAAVLAMSPRTLSRKLGAADVKFQDLLDRERRLTAEDYLANSNLTIQQIAYQCNFSDAQNFSQAFKRWSGMSPTEYRKLHQR